MATTDIEEATALVVDDEHVVILRPGTVVTDAEWSIMIEHACRGYQLAPDQVLVTPYGFAPMPRPPRANRDGSGRLWPGTAPAVAIHPVFWLPPEITAQGDTEDDDTYAIRMHLELVDRQMLDPDDQTVRNPFYGRGRDDSNPNLITDVTHPNFIADLTDYMAGERVDWLARFTIPEGPTKAAVIGDLAKSLATTYRDRYHRLKVRFADRASEVFHDQKGLLDRADQTVDTSDLLAAAQAHEAGSTSDTATALSDAVERFIGILNGYGRAGAVMVSAERVALTGEPADLNAQLTRLANDEEVRANYLRQRANRAVRDPDNATLAALWTAITQAWEHVVAEGRSAAQKASTARGDSH